MAANFSSTDNYITSNDEEAFAKAAKFITPRSLLKVDSLTSLGVGINGPITCRNIWSSSFKSEPQTLSSASISTHCNSIDGCNDFFNENMLNDATKPNYGSMNNYSFDSSNSVNSCNSIPSYYSTNCFTVSDTSNYFETNGSNSSSNSIALQESNQVDKLHPQINYRFTSYCGTQFSVPKGSRFFVIKSYNILDINASLTHSIWTSTDLGNKRLNQAFNELTSGGKIFLFFSVNASGKFSGVCEMKNNVDFTITSDIWVEKSRWKGVFPVEWLIIKDVANKYFHHLKIASNEFKPVTNSRDTQEIPYDIGISMLKIISSFRVNN